jgi:TRAP transporter TAXI family solute receptor
MKRFGQVFIVAVLALGLMSGMAAAQKKKFVTVASARPGGSWYITGAGWAEFLNKYIPGIEAKVEQSGGGVHNVKLVSEGKADFGPSVGRLVAMARVGKGPFKGKKYLGVRLLVSYWTVGVLQISTLNKSGLKSICDLKGKRAALGPAGGGGIPGVMAAFKACGFTRKDVTASYMSYDQGRDNLMDGNVDAFLSYAAVPVPAIKALEAVPTAKWRLLSLPEDRVASVVKASPGYIRYVVKKSDYNRPSDTVTIGAPNILVANKDLPEDFVYRVTKAMMENIEEFKKIHPAHKQMSKKNSAKSIAGLQFHPGAIRYYKEAGLM